MLSPTGRRCFKIFTLDLGWTAAPGPDSSGTSSSSARSLRCFASAMTSRFWRSLGWRPISFGVPLRARFWPGRCSRYRSACWVPLCTRRKSIFRLNRCSVLPAQKSCSASSSSFSVRVAEELAFRGFLMPLLIRSLGAAGGIVLTGVIFGSVHGYEYQWSWQYMLLISLVGCIFGWAKYKTQSTHRWRLDALPLSISRNSSRSCCWQHHRRPL